MDSLDYEAELAFIVGKDARNVPPEQARDYIDVYKRQALRSTEKSSPAWRQMKTM